MISFRIERLLSHKSLAAGLLLFGTITRVAQYASRRSFWSDEALLFLNIRDQSIGGLLGHLDFGQAAPPGFLIAERMMMHFCGAGEYSMRFLPLLAGLLALFIFARLAWRLFAPAIACVLIAMFVLCDEIIWHTASLKQYSLEILAAVIVLHLALARSERPVWRRLTACAIFSAIAIWFSYTTIFMFGAATIALGPRLSRDGRGRVVIALVLFLGSFLTLYVSVMRHQADPYLAQFWGVHRHAFANYGRPIGILGWLLRETFFILDTPFPLFGVILLMFVATGIYSLWTSRRREYLGLCLAPFGLVAVAGFLHQYPYASGRMTVFLEPGLFILFGFGLAYLLRLSHRWVQWIGCAALAPLVCGASLSIYHLAIPRTRSMIRPAALYVRAHRRPGEGLYLIGEGRNPSHPAIESGRSRELFCYWRSPPPPVHTTMTSAADIPERRFWVVFAFLPRSDHRDMQFFRPLLAQMDLIADEEDRFVEPEGGAAILFERRESISR